MAAGRGFRRWRSSGARIDVDLTGWRHPRPSLDPRLSALTIGLTYVTFVQAFVYRPPTSVAAQAWDTVSAIAVFVLVAIGTALLLVAGRIRDQLQSWMLETGSCVAFVGQGGLQFYALVSVNSAWWSTSTLAWSLGWGAGNAVRAFVLIRRLR